MKVHVLKYGSTLCGVPWSSLGDPHAKWTPFNAPLPAEHELAACGGELCSTCAERHGAAHDKEKN